MATLKNVTINDTGFVQVASGDSAERNNTNGNVRFNNQTNRVEQYVNGVWRTVDGTVSASSGTTLATGGSITTAGGFRIHTFTSVGAATFNAPYTGRVEVLTVAGGGGGAPIGGGAGAGGFIYQGSVQVVGGTNYTATVGGGGTGGLHHFSDEGQPGGNSRFQGPNVDQLAIGGGKGGYYSGGSTIPAMSGGSGGGGPGGNGSPGTTYTSYPGEHPGGTGVIGQGHPGGYGHHGSGPGYPNPGCQGSGATHAGGSGGGAGSRGISRYSNWVRCHGGQGLTNAITGSAVIYAAGGAGGTHVNPAYGHSPDPGGAGDGTGNSGTHGGAVATAGGTNRGGGGGGGAHPGGENPAGAGGPGVVVVRYRV
jgi:hypothetical protein